jgi:sugar phosphate isomerase/epimerase
VPTLCLNLLNLAPRYPDAPPLGRMLDAAAATGVSLVSLDPSIVRAHEAAGGSVASLARELAQRGLRCYELLFLECDPARAEGTLRYAEKLSSWAAELGASWLLAAATTAPLAEPLVDLFGRTCDVLAKAGTGVAFEFFPWARVASLAAADELVRRCGRRNAGVLLDAWHFCYGPDDWPALETVPLERIAYVQFTDAIAVPPERLLAESETSRRFPGEGCLELGRFADTLLRRGWDGVVSIEVLSPETRALGAEVFAKRCVESTRRFWEDGRGLARP